jgi:uncharacterized repeat protein (TIGR01451 family)
MAAWQSSARSLEKGRKQKKNNTRRLRFDRPQCERLEPRWLLSADLVLNKTANVANVSAGGEVQYQITISNSGPNATSAATNTVLTDTLPQGETLINASTANGGTVSISGNTITENLGSIATGAGNAATVTIDAFVNGQVNGTLTNTASVSTPDENGGLPISSAPVSTLINALTGTAPALSITKTAANNDAAVQAGGTETYTLTVTNTSANTASGVNVYDELPANAAFQSGTLTIGNGSPTALTAGTNLTTSGNLETINVGSLNAGQSATVSMTVSVPGTSVTVPNVAAGVMVNTATVTSTSGNTTAANASAQVATSVYGTSSTTGVDLSVTKSANASTSAGATVGANQTFTITVTNQGSADATHVVISDVLPLGAQFVAGSASVGGVSVTGTNGVVSALLPTLAHGQTATVTVTATPTVTGALTDTAYVESDQNDTTQANNSASATILVNGTLTPSVDLSVTKTAANNNAAVTLGNAETYTITVTNNSANAATGVVVSDLLPTNATFGAATVTGGGTVSHSQNVLTDTIGSLAAHGTATLTVTLTPTAAGVVTDTAYVSSDQVDTNLLNNIASLSTPIQGTAAASTALTISKTAANSNADVALGSNETYTVVVTNTGSVSANGVVVADVLSPTATLVGGTATVNGTSGGVTFSTVNGAIVADFGSTSLSPNGGTATLTLTVTPTVTGTLTDTAYVESSNTTSVSTSPLTTNIVPTSAAVDVSIAKVATPSPANAGQPLTYTLVVSNTGAGAAANVNVSDTLPTGVTFVSGSMDISGVTSNLAAPTNGTITASLGTVPAGTIDTVTIVVTPNANTAGTTITNSARVTTSSANSSPLTTASVDTTINAAVTAQPVVSIFKSASPNPGAVGASETYTLIVTNSSTVAANNVMVTDNLPASVTFDSGSTSVSGVNVTNTNGTVTANLGTLAAGAADTVTIIVTPNQTGTLQNTATVSATNNSPNAVTSATANTTINAANAVPNVSIAKTAAPSPATANQSLTYTIVVSDAAGAANASNVTVTDTLPSGISSQVTATDTTRNVSLSVGANGLITDTIPSLAAGGSDTITVTVTPTQAGSLTNTANVSVASNVSSQTSATVNTTVNAASTQPNVSITKTASPSPATVGQSLTYTIVVSDAAGAANASNVTVTDTLPSTGVSSQVTATDTTRNVSLTVGANGVITDTIPSLAAGGSDTITVTVTPTQTGTLTNTASVTAASNISNQTTAVVNTTVNQSVTPPGESCYLNGQPGDNSNQTFVTNLYRELFGRDPDSQGFQNWVSALQSGSLTRQDLVNAFLHSQEYEDHWVDCMFELFLGRHVDPGAEKFFVNQLNNGATEQSEIIAILTSPEYFHHPGPGGPGRPNGPGKDEPPGHGPAAADSNEAFVDNLYTDLLGRPADPGSEQAWVNALNSGQLTRAQVAQSFLNSSEEASDMLDAPGSAPGAPGTPATGTFPIGVLTGGGWDNLYFQGRLNSLNSAAVQQVMSQLESNTSWQSVEQYMLDLPQYFS